MFKFQHPLKPAVQCGRSREKVVDCRSLSFSPPPGVPPHICLCLSTPMPSFLFFFFFPPVPVSLSLIYDTGVWYHLLNHVIGLLHHSQKADWWSPVPVIRSRDSPGAGYQAIQFVKQIAYVKQ